MKTLRILILALLACGVFGSSAFAQQYTISHTTLNGAINATQTTLVLGSASASTGSSFGAPAAGQCLAVDGELMNITAIASTTATVRRATSHASAHANAAVIWTAPCNAFKAVDPPALGNNQTCSVQPAPWINTSNGNVWWCNTITNAWSGSNFAHFTYNSVPTAQ